VRVKEGAYAGKIGTIVNVTRFQNPALDFCVVSWRPERIPASVFKLHQVERITDEPKPEKKPIFCAKCGKDTGKEAIGAHDQILCIPCGGHLLREKPQAPEIEIAHAQVEEAPAPRFIEQPKQDQIPMVQLSLF
jgi:hypothetical protein